MKEEVVLFGQTKSLVGITTEPLETKKDPDLPAFIFLNSGILHRVGPNRLSVRMARDLAALGFFSFRIDFSGIGDSTARADNLSIEERWINEVQEAMAYLKARKGIKQFVLIGNCSGAYISLKAARCNPQVVGAVLINLPGGKTHPRYYVRLALLNRKIWLRLIKGTAKPREIVKMVNSYVRGRSTSGQDQTGRAKDVGASLHSMVERGSDLLIVYCEWDNALDYFQLVLRKKIDGLNSGGKVKIEIIPGMNHDFNLVSGQEHLLKIVHRWATQMVRDKSVSLNS